MVYGSGGGFSEMKSNSKVSGARAHCHTRRRKHAAASESALSMHHSNTLELVHLVRVRHKTRVVSRSLQATIKLPESADREGVCPLAPAPARSCSPARHLVVGESVIKC